MYSMPINKMIYQVFLLLIVLASLFANSLQRNYEGYSYNKFSGPVSGEVAEVYNRQGLGPAVDYVANPDYSYSYGVDDGRSGNQQSHHESRNGNTVHGEYSVVEPDGKVRVVKYTADDVNGFQAVVHYL